MTTHSSTKKIADYWNMRGQTYSKSWLSLAKKRLSTIETNLVEKTIINILKTSKNTVKTLDVGIAIGRISEKILKYNVELYGTDISQTMIKICKNRFKNNKKIKKFSIHNILYPIPENWGKFDLVTAFRVISYSPQWKKELINIYNALNPGGTLIFTFPNKYSSHFISTRIIKRKLDGCSVSLNELRKTVTGIGFSNIYITGYSRLLDSFYDWANNKISSNILYLIEKILNKLLGPTLFVRMFYVICKK